LDGFVDIFDLVALGIVSFLAAYDDELPDLVTPFSMGTLQGI
jgi:hypothetical protein